MSKVQRCITSPEDRPICAQLVYDVVMDPMTDEVQWCRIYQQCPHAHTNYREAWRCADRMFRRRCPRKGRGKK